MEYDVCTSPVQKNPSWHRSPPVRDQVLGARDVDVRARARCRPKCWLPRPTTSRAPTGTSLRFAGIVMKKARAAAGAITRCRRATVHSAAGHPGRPLLSVAACAFSTARGATTPTKTTTRWQRAETGFPVWLIAAAKKSTPIATVCEHEHRVCRPAVDHHKRCLRRAIAGRSAGVA